MQYVSIDHRPLANVPVGGNPAWERHYSIGEMAAHWRVSRETIRKLFMQAPGVIRITLGKKKAHTRWSIPASVAVRVHNRLVDRAA